MSDDDSPAPFPVLPRTVTDPAPGSPNTGRHERGPSLEEQVDYLVVHVDRLRQSNKLLKWAVSTAITAALGSALTIAKMLYGMGADDQVVKNGIERAQREVGENKQDIHELQKFVYRRFGVDATKPTPPTTIKEDPP